jgi:hypothetical protein
MGSQQTVDSSQGTEAEILRCVQDGNGRGVTGFLDFVRSDEGAGRSPHDLPHPPVWRRGNPGIGSGHAPRFGREDSSERHSERGRESGSADSRSTGSRDSVQGSSVGNPGGYPGGSPHHGTESTISCRFSKTLR